MRRRRLVISLALYRKLIIQLEDQCKSHYVNNTVNYPLSLYDPNTFEVIPAIKHFIFTRTSFIHSAHYNHIKLLIES